MWSVDDHFAAVRDDRLQLVEALGISASEHTGDESAHVVTAELLADASNDLRAGGITRFVP